MEKGNLLSKTPNTFYLIRHPQSFKNINDIHGGKGEPLTEVGILQAQKISLELKKLTIQKKTLLIGQSVPQVKECIDIINLQCNFETQINDNLKGLNLGTLSGVSKEEGYKIDKEASERLELWRNGKIKIHELQLPESEDIENFKNRIFDIVKRLQSLEFDNIIIVGTTSVLIMITNLLILNDKFSYETYKVIEFQNGSITILEKQSDLHFNLIKLNDLKHLE